jgi:hypothetical protein
MVGWKTQSTGGAATRVERRAPHDNTLGLDIKVLDDPKFLPGARLRRDEVSCGRLRAK